MPADPLSALCREQAEGGRSRRPRLRQTLDGRVGSGQKWKERPNRFRTERHEGGLALLEAEVLVALDLALLCAPRGRSDHPRLKFVLVILLQRLFALADGPQGFVVGRCF